MEQVRPYSSAIWRLRDAGLRPTRQRLALARLLFENGNRHVTAEALKKDADAAGVRVSLATIYNTLNQFTGAGLLREVVVESDKSYFDTNVTQHHHFYSEEDGVLMDIADTSISLPDLPSPPSGMTVSQVDVVIRLKKNN